MPLSDGGEMAWPPKEWHPVTLRYAEHAAWYSGDPQQLGAAYVGTQAPITVGGQAMWRTNFDRFWARTQFAPQRRQMLHIPIASDIATTSADQLFSQTPAFVIEEAESSKTGGAAAIQDRLDDLVEAAEIGQTLTEAAELAAALGGTFLRVTWDREVEPDHPLLTMVDVDQAVPEWRWGRLTAVTFWSVVEMSDNPAGHKEVWRHLERHEPGVVLHGLYRGTDAHLGERMPLAAMPSLYLDDDVVQTGIDDLTAVYVPNMRPNRVHRGSSPGRNCGRSDYDGVEPLMDALDETWTSWMRDLRLARARLIVPQEYFDVQGKGKGALFDVDQEVFEALPMSFGRDSGTMITPSQFAIRTAEHGATAMGLVERIISAAGYSASTFGLQDSESRRAVTATEIINRERRSFVTRAKKIRYWTGPLARILETLLAIDAAQFGGPGSLRPRVDFDPDVHDDPQEMAATVQALRAATVLSVETAVRMVHGDWSDEEVEAEVQRIDDEGKAQMPDLTGFGAPAPADQQAPGQEQQPVAVPAAGTANGARGGA
jgi:A118 family predicted phage portal protein